MIAPKNHPRKESLKQRQLLEKGIKKGITTLTSMIAFGRGEAFDYLLGEKTTPPAQKAAKAAAALLLASQKPVLSVNGSTCMLCPKQLVDLAKELNAQIEANIFYPPQKRRKTIAKYFSENFGKKILGAGKLKKIQGTSSNRGLVDEKGIWTADTVLVALEDGDRTQFLKGLGKKVIAVDLNPKSRTAKKADITIVDNITRALPLIEQQVKILKKEKKEKLEKITSGFDNKQNLKEALKIIKSNVD